MPVPLGCPGSGRTYNRNMVAPIVAIALLAGSAPVQEEPPGLRCVLVVPHDEPIWPDARERLDLILKDVQWYFSCQMEAHGYGRKTFKLEMDPWDKVVVHVARLDESASSPSDTAARRSAVIRAAEAIVGDAQARQGAVMAVVYNGYFWSPEGRFRVEPMGFAQRGRWAHFTGWHYFSINPKGFADSRPVPRLPLLNDIFPEVHTRVLKATTPDGVRTVAERTSAGHGAFISLIGIAFGAHRDASADASRDILRQGIWRVRGNFVDWMEEDYAGLSASAAADLNANPLFKVREIGAPSTRASRRTGMRGAGRAPAGAAHNSLTSILRRP
jgi:hypothetical protein